MWFIINFLIVSILNISLVAQSNICNVDDYKISSIINNLEITECNCNCSIQSNQFYIKSNTKKEIYYKIDGISTISNSDKRILKKNINPTINYLLSNKKLCESNYVVDGNINLYFYTLVPNSVSYCYELVGYLSKEEKFTFLNDDISFKSISTIAINKQSLYSSPNQKTKMYLIKGDKVEILEEKDDWLYILYHGKKDIKAWIPKSAIEETEINQEIKPVSKNIEIKEEKTFFTKLLEFFNISKINQNTKIMQS